MRRNNILIFDDYIPARSPAIVALSPTKYNHALGAFDQLAIMAVVSNLNNATDGFNVWVAHSGDARLWLYRKNEKTSPPATGDINWTPGTLSTGLENYAVSLDAGTIPLLAFVRLEMAFSSTHTGGHVKVYITQRDQGG